MSYPAWAEGLVDMIILFSERPHIFLLAQFTRFVCAVPLLILRQRCHILFKKSTITGGQRSICNLTTSNQSGPGSNDNDRVALYYLRTSELKYQHWIFSYTNNVDRISSGLRNRRKRVRTPVTLLRSLSGKYPWERYEPSYPPSYGLNSTTTVRGCPRDVMVKAMDSGIVVSEFVLQSRYYVHFRANTPGKGMNPLILPAMG